MLMPETTSATGEALRQAVRQAHLADEAPCVARLAALARLDDDARQRVQAAAARLVRAVRAHPGAGVESFLAEFGLDSREGVVLMCLAEALLRIPDAATAELLIRDKLPVADWERHLGRSGSLFVNASTWGLLLTGKVVAVEQDVASHGASLWRRLLARGGEVLVRPALKAAMEILARQFVMGETLSAALERGAPGQPWLYSYDMLGEAALTARDAARYRAAYADAIDTLAQRPHSDAGPWAAPGISVKLSALHPRYEWSQRQRVLAELVPSLRNLVLQARRARLVVTLDAEEAERLELMLDVFQAVLADPALQGWDGFGLALQAYQKRALAVVDWLEHLARGSRHRIPLRLVKGAYWDSEIKRAQSLGLAGYPVFTRKRHTDVSYLACARRLLAAPDCFFPQFATHNAYTIAYLLEAAQEGAAFEFQRLHGMGEALYREVLRQRPVQCRVYAPVGSLDALLPYLVRRLLENGANVSFVNRIAHPDVPVERLVADPVERTGTGGCAPNPRIPLPRDLYAPDRDNSVGISPGDPPALERLQAEVDAASRREWRAAPLVGGSAVEGSPRTVVDPSDWRRVVGTVVETDGETVDQALRRAVAAAPDWDATPAAERARILERAAELMEAHRGELMYLIVREGGRTFGDALAEVREASDFCRYYGMLVRRPFWESTGLPGPTGESNRLALHGRGVFAAISPWNFPLAIFVGQVAAALAAGNTVVAKPAPQTPLTAVAATRLLLAAGVPPDALHLLPGGAEVGGRLAADARVAGVAFTGSVETARAIQQSLAARSGPLVPLIAETGGLNCMVADSSALAEQLVADVVRSAFNSAGQRCSALRLLFVQQDAAPRLLDMLAGAMAELKVGDPLRLDTDLGPIIDEPARHRLHLHCRRLEREARCLAVAPLPEETRWGTFFAPRAFEIDSPGVLQREVFGPVLHVVRWRAGELDRVVDAINATGYGLTLGIHSRIERTIHRILERVRAGNCYVNRDMIGAVVGVQPFGGEGLSGTGPKAGGPHSLLRFALERCVSVNTAAGGGNLELLRQADD